jgi:hypothetical protein
MAALTAAACGSSAPAPPDQRGVVDAAVVPAIDARPDATPSCVHDGDPVSEAPLRARVAYLASLALGGREAGTLGEALARDHVAARFACLGLIPAGDDGGYLQAFEQAGRPTANVLGYVAGTDPVVGTEVIVVGAHVDHVGTDGKRVWAGANDNASGVAVMLAIAQLVRQREHGPRRTIAFVGFGAEETGLHGSAFLVEHLPAALALDRVAYMVNLDMVGSYASRHRMQAYGAFAGLPARAVLDELLPAYPELEVRLGNHSNRSDHERFCDHGIPYVFMWTPDATCYHRTCDTADRLDYASMSRIAALSGELLLRLADAPTDLLASRARTGCGKKKKKKRRS